ncbi:LPS export ABC transporter periplasmic protein LptC [Sulfitobacter sp.]|jgi:lipopolysaccharide export system protein LptC|uniref:LPS export ABC transporter periplasmic protein LptC n=1 Tax=Sulfitobacter sp. TaxID=1903071 RepID=UPI00306BD2E1
MIARDRYSRMVSLLKVAFPLGALALLSTLFLIARAMETDTPIPFADIEIQERLRDQQITGPFFSGTTQTGDQMSFSAEKLITLQDNVGKNRAEEVKATLRTTKGATFELQADVAELDIAGNSALLSGAVSMATSSGYRINTEQLTSQISTLDVTAPETVEATGPLGELTAGNMRIFAPNDGENTQMLFSGGVKLIYTPK